MNKCSRNLISEIVLLVPVLHLLRKLNGQCKGAKSDPGSALNEQSWAGLENIEYPSFRERIRGFADKRRFVRIPLEEHFQFSKFHNDLKIDICEITYVVLNFVGWSFR